MRDLVVLAIIASFFALCVAYVRWCDRIIGPDPDLDGTDPLAPAMPDAAGATAPEVVAS